MIKDDENLNIKILLIDLYLSVKIRKNEDIDDYNSTQLEYERKKLLEQNISYD